MPVTHDRLRFRRGTSPFLPVIKDENEPAFQDLCEVLNISQNAEKRHENLAVRSSNGRFYDENVRQSKRQIRRRNTDGNINLMGRKISSAKTPKANSLRLPTIRTKSAARQTDNLEEYQPEVLDLNCIEDVEKLAYKFFGALRSNGETLEVALQRLYGEAGWEHKCLEFTQVGNCKPICAQRKLILPNVDQGRQESKVYTNEKGLKLPNVFQVSFSEPVSLPRVPTKTRVRNSNRA